MMWRRMYCVLLCLVLCALYCFRSFADEYTLTEEDFMAPEGYPQAETNDVNGGFPVFLMRIWTLISTSR